MSEQTMPTLDELREVIERRRQTYDSHLMDMPVNWENIAAMVSGIADAQNEYIAALEADRAAQQQRIAELERLNRRANSLLGSCWSLLLHVLGGHYPRPEIEQMVNKLEAWNVAQHVDAGEKGER